MFGYQTSRKDAKFVDQHDATIICFCQGSIEFPGVNNVIIYETEIAIWAGFGPVTEKNGPIMSSFEGVFFMFSWAKINKL